MGAQAGRFAVPNAPYLLDSNCRMLTVPFDSNSDEVGLLYCDADIQSLLKESINEHWPNRIDRTLVIAEHFHRYKLFGNPFGSTNSSALSMSLARVMCSFISGMLQRGWMPRPAINFSRKTKSDTFLFVRESRDDIRTKVSALDLSSSDQLHLIGFPGALCLAIEELIMDHWPGGLKRSKTYDNRTDQKFIFKGYPWRERNKELFSVCRSLLLDIIREVYKKGFVLLTSGHPQQSAQEVDTLYFAPAINPQPAHFFIFGVVEKNRLFVVDSPAECLQAIRESIKEAWPKGIAFEEKQNNMVSFELRGHPWCSKGQEAHCARKVILACLRRVRALGWRVEGTIDVMKDVDDASFFLMARCESAEHAFFAMKLGGLRTIRLLDAPMAVVSAVERAITTTWPAGLEEKEVEDPVFRLSRPFHECMAVMCFIIGAVEELGWTLVSAADLSVKHEDLYKQPLDLHTLIFEKTR